MKRNIRFYRVVDERGQSCQTNTTHKVIHNESNALPGHEQRMKDNIERVHWDIGPIPHCKCDICGFYSKMGECGQYHIDIAEGFKRYDCKCKVCQCIRVITKMAIRAVNGFPLINSGKTRRQKGYKVKAIHNTSKTHENSPGRTK